MTCSFHHAPMCGCPGCWVNLTQRLEKLELDYEGLLECYKHVNKRAEDQEELLKQWEEPSDR